MALYTEFILILVNILLLTSLFYIYYNSGCVRWSYKVGRVLTITGHIWRATVALLILSWFIYIWI